METPINTGASEEIGRMGGLFAKEPPLAAKEALLDAKEALLDAKEAPAKDQ